MLQKNLRQTGHDRHYGVTFQNGTKQMLGMLDAVMFQEGADQTGTHKLATIISISSTWNRTQQPD